MDLLFFLPLALWIAFLVNLLRGLKNLERLDQFHSKLVLPFAPVKLPKVSIVIAVKDEEKLIGGTLLNLKNIGYENLEVIIVNDRSTDKTQEIIENFIQTNPHFKVVKVAVLPPGWLGKVHALNQGTQVATGDFLLYMDPGAHFDADLLVASVRVCEHYHLDHLSIMPNIHSRYFFLEVLMTTAFLFYVASGKPWLPVGKRPASAAKGAGIFNFVRRDFFITKTPGLEWLKMEVIEDVGLAQLIASSKGRSHFMSAGEFSFNFNWYETLKEMVVGLEKNTVGAFGNYNFALAGGVSLLALAVPLYPLIALVDFPRPFFIACGLVYLLGNLLFAILAKRWVKRSVRVLFMLPVGLGIMGVVLLRSTYLCFKNDGIFWSGTFYPVRSLREGKRVKFGP